MSAFHGLRALWQDMEHVEEAVKVAVHSIVVQAAGLCAFSTLAASSGMVRRCSRCSASDLVRILLGKHAEKARILARAVLSTVHTIVRTKCLQWSGHAPGQASSRLPKRLLIRLLDKQDGRGRPLEDCEGGPRRSRLHCKLGQEGPGLRCLERQGPAVPFIPPATGGKRVIDTHLKPIRACRSRVSKQGVPGRV